MFFKKTAKVLAFAAAVTVVSWAQSGSASASDCGYQPHCYWKTVTVYKTVQRPYIDYITKYRPCGTAYRAKVVRYRSVQVPVTKRVKICY